MKGYMKRLEIIIKVQNYKIWYLDKIIELLQGNFFIYRRGNLVLERESMVDIDYIGYFLIFILRLE